MLEGLLQAGIHIWQGSEMTPYLVLREPKSVSDRFERVFFRPQSEYLASVDRKPFARRMLRMRIKILPNSRATIPSDRSDRCEVQPLRSQGHYLTWFTY